MVFSSVGEEGFATAAVRRVGGEGGNGIECGIELHLGTGPGGPDMDLLGESGIGIPTPSTTCLGCDFKVGVGVVLGSPKPNLNGARPLGTDNSSFVAFGVLMKKDR